MAVEFKETHKIDFANISHRGMRRQGNYDSYDKSPNQNSDLASPKGQLFIVADAKSGNSAGSNAADMAIRIIRENYYSYPSRDIPFSLQRAFDIANRQLYHYAKANGLQRKFGATCSALVIKKEHAYVAHVGDCKIYSIGPKKTERLTKDHTRIIEPPKDSNGSSNAGIVPQNSRVTRALGVKLGIKVDLTAPIPVTAGEYFLLCSDGLKSLEDKEIQKIVLANPPQLACDKLIELSKERGSQDDTAVQIIKYYNQDLQKPVETSARTSGLLFFSTLNWPVYLVLVLVLLVTAFLVYEPLTEKFFSSFGYEAVTNNLQNSETESEAFEKQQFILAAEHLKFKRWDNALQIYQAILENNNENTEAKEGILLIARGYREQGDEAYQQQRWANALFLYNKSVKLNPEYSDLSRQIALCQQNLEKPGIFRSKEVTETGGGAKLENKQSMEPLSPVLEGFDHSQWKASGLYENDDFRIKQSELLFRDNLRIKKIFLQQQYQDMEMEVIAKVLSGSGAQRFGIILGHNWDDGAPEQNFYLFTVSLEGSFAFQKVTQAGVQTLISEAIKPGILGHTGQAHLRVKSLDGFILMYANGELLKMAPIGQPVKGGIGLYADPKISVEFSRLKISPVLTE